MKKLILIIMAAFMSFTAFAAEEVHFPLIKIVSTQNGGSNAFITEPVAAHVKEAQQSWFDFSNVDKPDPYYEKCEITVDGATYAGQVKVRGNWTTNYPKKSLRIKLDKKQNILGLNNGNKFKNWVLLACYKDSSFLRDAAAFTMFKAMFPSYYSSDCRLVEVEANGEYLGVYLLAEQQEIKKDRIDLTEPSDEDPNATNIGYLIEFDSYYYTEKPEEQFEIDYIGKIEDSEGTKLRNLQAGYTIKSDINDKAQHDFIAGYMNKVWEICYRAAYKKTYYRFNSSYELEKYTPEGANDDAKAQNCIAQVLDLESLANMYIFNELICDPDLYLTSFFMTVDLGEGKDHRVRFEAPWDSDSAMGNKRFCANSPDNFNGDIKTSFAGRGQPDVNGSFGEGKRGNPWMVVFVKSGWFKKLVKEQWKKLDTKKVLAQVNKLIDENSSASYQAVYELTRSKWGIAQNGAMDELCEASRKAALSSQAESAAYLKKWISDRFKAVENIIKKL